MNTELHQYPSALYSAVSETGYRGERFTGEALRSGTRRQAAHRRPRLEWLRSAVTGIFGRSHDGEQTARRTAKVLAHASSPHH